MDQKYERTPIFRFKKTYQGGYGIGKANSHTLSTKPTRLATGVVCYPSTEQNRPYKTPGPAGI